MRTFFLFAFVFLVRIMFVNLAAANRVSSEKASNDWKERSRQRRDLIKNLGQEDHVSDAEAFQAIIYFEDERIQWLQEKIAEHEAMLADHFTGRETLTEERQVLAETQLVAMYKSVDKMMNEPEDKKLKRVREAQQAFLDLQRNDYIDWHKTGLSD